jgi:phage nucleotide-binding protein
MGEGIENGTGEGIKVYYNSFPVITDQHINEAIKFEYLIPRVQELIPPGSKFEVEISTPEMIGYIDLLTKDYDIYDFKYSNNVKNYLNSPQLSLYKYFFEKQHPDKKIRNLYFMFIPKVQIKQKKTEELYEFRKRIQEELQNSSITIKKIEFDQGKVTEFYQSIEKINNEKDFPKEPSYLCKWCEYEKYCHEGVDYMLLPKNERREKLIDVNPDMWIYADSYVGKSTFADQFDDLLFINTDGNTDNTTSPVIKIADVVTTEGRMTKRKFAWNVFLEVIQELEKKDNDYKRICLDLVEDLYEHCRLYTYDKLGIQHETDAGYGKGWDMVRTEFLTAIKRLKNLGYQIIYISKETITEITLKSGSKITTFKPNINDKVANVLAGTVDLTVRAYMDGEERFLQLEKKETIFGGGRFAFKLDKIPLDKDEFLQALKDAQDGIKTHGETKEENKPTTRKRTPKAEDSTTPEPKEVSSTQEVQEIGLETKEAEQAKPRTRKKRGE